MARSAYYICDPICDERFVHCRICAGTEKLDINKSIIIIKFIETLKSSNCTKIAL